MTALLNAFRNQRLQGFALLAALAFLCASALGPNISSAIDDRAEAGRITTLLQKHERILASPVRETPYAAFSAFVLSADGEQTSDDQASRLQADLIERLRRRQTRTVDLRRIDDDTNIDGLVGLQIQATFEGDLQAVLDALSELDQVKPALTVSSITLKATGPNNRTDRKVLVTATFTQWTGAQP